MALVLDSGVLIAAERVSRPVSELGKDRRRCETERAGLVIPFPDLLTAFTSAMQ